MRRLILVLYTLFNLSSSLIVPPTIEPFINPSLAGASLISSYGLIKNVNNLGNLNSNITRKLVHISSAPLFISTWDLYNDNNPELWAGLVPVLSSLYLLNKKEELSPILSRSGNSDEIVNGPLIYTIILSLITIILWKKDMGIVAMNQLAIGDGFSDIIGRRFGNNKWFYNKNKSVEGTMGFIVTAFMGNEILLHQVNLKDILLISLICGLIETLPYIDDNISVPVTAIICYNLLN
tara:strand:+ start:3267 stop:3974 length:708 start_codon:yes stop_codon:yes gene_type:complete